MGDGVFQHGTPEIVIIAVSESNVGEIVTILLRHGVCIQFTYRNLYYYVLYVINIIISGYTLPVGVKPV